MTNTHIPPDQVDPVSRRIGLKQRRLGKTQRAREPEYTRPPATGPPTALDAHRIISEAETARLFSISVDTLRRMCARGEAPPRIRISLRRVGFRLADCLAWVKSREELK
jgi:predicted DNA-binding transcriptional regulator AlpA